MPYNLENLNPGTRFPHPLPGEDTSQAERENPPEWVEFRIADADFLNDLQKKYAVTKQRFVQPEKKSGKVNTRAPLQHVEYQEVPESNRDAYQADLWDYAITAWRLLDTIGAEIPCTRENKTILMRKSAAFALYANECLERLREHEEEQKEIDQKNLKTS